MKLLKRVIVIFFIYLLIRNFHLFFIYKDALFSIGAKRELSGKIVYDSSGEVRGTIVIIEFPSGKKRIIPREITIGWKPSFSPDGKKIVFQGSYDILYMINADGTGLEEFFNFRRIAKYASWDEVPGARAPSWSPDGKKIAFISGTGELYITDVNNPYAFKKILTDIRLANLQPAWSPDSRKIAVVTERWALTTAKVWGEDYPAWFFAGHILIVNTDGTGVKELIPGSSPAWSPDGKRIAYRAYGSYWIIDADDENGLSKKFIFSTETPIIKSGVSVPPCWSPDGKYLIVGKKLWFYTDGIYAIPIDNPKRKIWIDADGEDIGGMSWVK